MCCITSNLIGRISRKVAQKAFTNLTGNPVSWTSLQSALNGGRRDGAESGDEAREDGGGQGSRVVDAPQIPVREAGGGGGGQLLAVKLAEDKVGNN